LLAEEVAKRHELEKLLDELEGRLAQVNQREQEFLAMLGHELRNPLAPITTSLCVMRRMKPDSQGVVQSRQIIERQIGLMVRLVDDLLDVSRISLGKIVLNRRHCELQAIIDLAVELAQPLLEKKRHVLTVELPEAPVSVYADPARLSQALANLLNNAAQYTDDGGRIGLSARVSGDRLALEVEDNGIGLTADQCEKVFDLFAQGQEPQDPGHGGLGVGLTLARTIIELHQGRVVASSEGAGKGSRFTIDIPLSRSEVQAGV
jgi:signal transduction histidine kinase